MRRAATEYDRLLERVRELLGAGDDALLSEACLAVNHALVLRPDSVEGWLLKCQVESATGDDLAALAAAEMAVARAPLRAECLYWRGAVLGSDEAVEGSVIQEVLDRQQGGKASTNLGNLFKKAFDQKRT